MATKGEFDGALSIEPVLGVRMFVIDAQGRLRGVSYDEVWKPGENTARCYVTYDDDGEWEYDEDGYEAALASWITQTSNGDYLVQAPPKRSAYRISGTRKPKEHDPAPCSCGYYAFYTPDVRYMAPGRAWGVIEGYGKTTIGPKGFRAQKAKILGLVLPEESDPMGTYYQTLVRRNYKDIPFFDTLGAMIREIPTTPAVAEDNEEFWNVPARQEEERKLRSQQAAQRLMRGGAVHSNLATEELYRRLMVSSNRTGTVKPGERIVKPGKANLEQMKQASLEAKEARRKIAEKRRKWFDV